MRPEPSSDYGTEPPPPPVYSQSDPSGGVGLLQVNLPPSQVFPASHSQNVSPTAPSEQPPAYTAVDYSSHYSESGIPYEAGMPVNPPSYDDVVKESATDAQ